MSFCSRCGVEIESGHQSCPLCHSMLIADDSPFPRSASYAHGIEDVPDLAERVWRRRGLITGVVSIVFLIPVIVCIMVDTMYSGDGWSSYVVVSLALAWSYVFIPLHFHRHPLGIMMSMLCATAAFLCGLDFLDGSIQWAINIGLPILGWVALGCLIGWVAVHMFRKQPGYIVASIFLAVAEICMGIDLSLHLAVAHVTTISWSMIVAAIMFPLAMIAWFVQYLFRRNPRMQRFLHW